jgi:hypothetical protein
LTDSFKDCLQSKTTYVAALRLWTRDGRTALLVRQQVLIVSAADVIGENHVETISRHGHSTATSWVEIVDQTALIGAMPSTLLLHLSDPPGGLPFALDVRRSTIGICAHPETVEREQKFLNQVLHKTGGSK